jgi:hypothetical protein
MKKVERFIRKWWWVLLLGLGVVLTILWKLLGPRGEPPPDDSVIPPTFVDRARDQVERVHLEGDVEKARVRATSDVQRKAIDSIEEKGKDDPKGARKDIAAFLSANL